MKNDQKAEPGEEGERPFLSADISGCKSDEWEEGMALRETFLVYFAEEPAEFLRWLAKKYSSWMFENDRYIDPSFRDSRAKAFLRAAMRDLHYIAQCLADAAQEAVEKKESRSDIESGWFADSPAVEVQALADKIDARINPKRKAKKNV